MTPTPPLAVRHPDLRINAARLIETLARHGGIVIITAMVAIGTIAARDRQPDGPPRRLGAVLSARLTAAVVVTVVVAVAQIAAGPLAAFAFGAGRRAAAATAVVGS